MRCVDVCMFNGDEIIKMRLDYYKEYFDTFYLIESWYTFSGKRKPFLFCEKYADWFAPYKDKVKFHILDDFHSLAPFEQEAHQRNSIVPRLLREEQDSLIFFSDCDEFYDLATLPSKESLYETTTNEKKIVHVAMKMYYCRFTNFYPTVIWTNAFITHTTLLQNTPDIHELRIYKNQRGVPIPCICVTSGWHFSYFMELDDIIRKIESFSHQELNHPRNKNRLEILKAINECRDIFGSTTPMEYKAFEDQVNAYPELFRKYHEKLINNEPL